MRAEVGDEFVIDGPELTQPGRTGTIIGLTNTDGSPPYVVWWLVGYESLVFPGPDVRIEEHHGHRAGTPAGA